MADTTPIRSFARINLPAKATRGQLVPVKLLISHPMESGFRVTDTGAPIPRNIITQLTVKLAGEIVFDAEIGTGIAANPYFAFSVLADRSGKLEVSWSGDNGLSGSASADLVVE